MKTEYVKTNWAEITPAIKAHFKRQSTVQGKILIPLAAHAAVPRTQKQRDADAHDATPRLVNLNTASPFDLAALDGIGPDGANRVIMHRPFESVDDLTKVGGIGPKTLHNLRDQIEV